MAGGKSNKSDPRIYKNSKPHSNVVVNTTGPTKQQKGGKLFGPQPLAVQHQQYSNLTSGSRESLKPHASSLNSRQQKNTIQRNNYTSQHQTHAVTSTAAPVSLEQQNSHRAKSKEAEKTTKRSNGSRHRVVMG